VPDLQVVGRARAVLSRLQAQGSFRAMRSVAPLTATLLFLSVVALGNSGAPLSAGFTLPLVARLAALTGPAAAEDAKTADELEAEAAGTLNLAALEKSKWQRAQPEGCKGGEEASKSRWCYVHDDGSLTLRNAGRLQRSLDDLEVRRKEIGDAYELTPQDRAALAVMVARDAADAKYAKKEKARRKDWEREQKAKKASGSDKKPPARRLPSVYRCRKDEKKPKTLAGLAYGCVVTDYTFDQKEVEDKKAGKKGQKEDDETRCKRLARWRKAYGNDRSVNSKGEKTHAKFWLQLADEQEEFGLLSRLRAHAHDASASSPKIQAALEKKAAVMYKNLAKVVHPDRLPKPCSKSNLEVAQVRTVQHSTAQRSAAQRSAAQRSAALAV
jgi:hypothetical protein